MLGESVLSLLVVDIAEARGYYKVFLDGVISIVLLEYLHFQSQPSNPDQHAMRQSLWSSFIFYWCLPVYSFALLVLGTSYKMFLFEFLYMELDGNDEYANVDSGHRVRRNILSQWDERWLAGGSSAALRFTADNRQIRIAHFFCGSLAVVFCCLDVMSLTHKGFVEKWKQCDCNDSSKTQKYLGLFLVLLRVAVLVIVATLSQYETKPDDLALIGLFSVVAQLLLRAFGAYVFGCDDQDEDAEERALERMIGYTAARVRETPADVVKGDSTLGVSRAE